MNLHRSWRSRFAGWPGLWLLWPLLAIPAPAADPARQVDALLQQAKTHQAQGQYRNALTILRAAQPLAESLDPAHRAAVLNALGETLWRTGAVDDARRELERSVTLARQAHALPIAAASLNHLGNLAADQGDVRAARAAWQESLTLARQAPDAALIAAVLINQARLAIQERDARTVEILLAEATRQTETLPASHDQAYHLLAIGHVRRTMSDGAVPQVQAMQHFTAAAGEADLRAARDTMERLKTSEVQDYFRDDCVAALESRTVALDRPPLQTAVLYPILLPDRLELLLSTATGLERFTVPVNREVFTVTVREFRRTLEKRTSREYLPSAQRLYDWLIRPLQGTLDAGRIATLVIVPDGPLRTIPLAALHDGRDFLIRRYAMATTPGLTLTDLHPIPRRRSQPLLAGLTEAVQGFPALVYVQEELAAIHAAYGGTVLKNEAFRLAQLQQTLQETPYPIVHIASHGQFAGDAQNTFLLTFDDKLTLNRLERLIAIGQYRDQPVELLTLSACQTAAGDDRAALGLAGVAVKAGARSVLATLWFINDQASALLTTAFYRQLQRPDRTKAEALQQAQIELLADRRYQHPGYWAPFLLIGNWF